MFYRYLIDDIQYNIINVINDAEHNDSNKYDVYISFELINLQLNSANTYKHVQ